MPCTSFTIRTVQRFFLVHRKECVPSLKSCRRLMLRCGYRLRSRTYVVYYYLSLKNYSVILVFSQINSSTFYPFPLLQFYLRKQPTLFTSNLLVESYLKVKIYIQFIILFINESKSMFKPRTLFQKRIFYQVILKFISIVNMVAN
jgi:hypothetical protein